EVLDQAEEERRERLHPAAAELGSQRRAALELLLRGRELALVVEEEPCPEMPLHAQRAILDLLRDADRSAELLQRLVGTSCVTLDRGERERGANLAPAVARLHRQLVGLVQPLLSLRGPPLPIVDPPEG